MDKIYHGFRKGNSDGWYVVIEKNSNCFQNSM